MDSRLLAFVLLGLVAVGQCSQLQQFLGKYESTDKRENTAAIAAATGQEDVTDPIFNEFTAEGEKFHHKFTIPSKNYAQDVAFKLNEEGTNNFNGKSYKYLYTLDGNKLKAEFTTPERKVVQSYDFNDQGFVKTYQLNDVVAKLHFKKV